LGHSRLFKYQPALLRHKLREARRISRKVHDAEKELIDLLCEFDEHRYFVRGGYRSLRRYCIHGLKFTRTQAQRIVTQVRRYSTTFDIVAERDRSRARKPSRHKTINDYDEIAPPYNRFQDVKAEPCEEE
jgi:hypothetical protein